MTELQRFLLLAGLLWIVVYLWGYSIHNTTLSKTITASAWFWTICGRPLPDQKVRIGPATMQALALVGMLVQALGFLGLVGALLPYVLNGLLMVALILSPVIDAIFARK